MKVMHSLLTQCHGSLITVVVSDSLQQAVLYTIINSESLDFLCYCAAQLAELTEYFFTKICAVMGEGGHLQQRGLGI